MDPVVCLCLLIHNEMFNVAIYRKISDIIIMNYVKKTELLAEYSNSFYDSLFVRRDYSV